VTFLPFVIVGHVDHGKSTLVGRLLADTGSLPQGKLEQVRQQCQLKGRPFEYAFLLDSLKDEQSQGITIDTTRIFFKTPKRRYMIFDAPGHIEFLKNMVTGAAKADAAFLVIDAKEGVQENSRRHGLLLSVLGIRQVVVLINKMDLVGYSRKTFEELKTEYEAYLRKLGVKPQGFIPISALNGDHLCGTSTKMSWYSGPSVLDSIEKFEATPNLKDLPFRMPVQDIYKFTEDSPSKSDRRIVVGTIESGRVGVGNSLSFFPSGKRSTIKTIEPVGSAPAEVSAGESVGFTLSDQIYLTRGEIACKTAEPACAVSSRIRASVFWLGKKPMDLGGRFTFKLGTARCEATLLEIRSVVQTESLDLATGTRVQTNEVADLVFDLDRTIAFETQDKHPTLGRFVLLENFEIGGGGVIHEVLKDPNRDLKESFQLRDLKWETSLVERSRRVEKHGHPASLVVVTGPKATPRKELAKALERHLFESGHATYFIGFGSLLYGVSSAVSDQSEQIRRLAEIAHLFLDAGMILIVSAQELNEEDLSRIRLAIPNELMEVIRLDDSDMDKNVSKNLNEAVSRLASKGFLKN
jgi:bifunctional enzyme CysN/CysC